MAEGGANHGIESEIQTTMLIINKLRKKLRANIIINETQEIEHILQEELHPNIEVFELDIVSKFFYLFEEIAQYCLHQQRWF